MGKKFKGPKDPWADLDNEFKTNVMSMKPEEIRARVAEINLDLQQLLNKKELDQDLKEKAFAFQEAGRQYREATKGAKLRTKYALYVLESTGKA